MLTKEPSFFHCCSPSDCCNSFKRREILLNNKKKLYYFAVFKKQTRFFHKVSVQGVVVLGGHFATLCQEVDFYEAFFSLSIFKKKRQILLHF